MSQPDNEREAEDSKIHSEEVKTDHTSHWDLDYLPTEQVESAYEEQGQTPRDEDSSDTQPDEKNPE